MLEIEKPKIKETTAHIDIEKKGIQTKEIDQRLTRLYDETLHLPDILSILRDELNITKRTIYEILIASKRLHKFLNNPEKFIEVVCRIIKDTKAKMLIEGIKYIKINGEKYIAHEVFDGELATTLDRALTSTRSVYDYVVTDDSKVERDFAHELENDKDVRFFFKLPSKFTIATPFGSYNPDWAIFLNEYGTDKLYLVIETKGSLQEIQRRVQENKKIQCAKMHFKEIGNLSIEMQ